MTEKNKTQINENYIKINALENVVSDELEKSDADVDTDLIEECLDYIVELKSVESSEEFRKRCSFTEDELEAKAKRIIEKHDFDKTSDKKTSCNNHSFIRIRKKALIIAACMIIFMGAFTVISYSFDQDGIFRSHMSDILKLARGESLRIGNTEYWNTSEDPVYSDIYDLLKTEDIESMLFPSLLESYTANSITETLRNDIIEYVFIYNEKDAVYYGVDVSASDTSGFADRYMDYDVIDVNGINYYVKSYEPDTPYYAYFTDGYYEYLLKCDTYEIIIEMINSITVYNSAE